MTHVRRAGILSGMVALVVAAVAAVAAIVRWSPWPSALVIRAVFARGARQTVDEMRPFVPVSGVTARTGLRYVPSRDTTFDLFRPDGASGPLPTIVWIHGGAWLSGSSTDVAPYLRILASRGFTTVGLDYTIAPEATYPTALRQLNAALGYLVENADDLGIDRDRLVLAGDSAGSQLASQLAALTTSPAYAASIGISPALTPAQLAAVVLHCGVYDLDALADLAGINGWGFKTALWAYSGTKDWSQSPAGTTMSVIRHVSPAFPSTFISGGNGDGLTRSQSVPFAAELRAHGVEVTELFWPEDHDPALPHEYQFHLDLAEAHQALEATVAFLRARTQD